MKFEKQKKDLFSKLAPSKFVIFEDARTFKKKSPFFDPQARRLWVQITSQKSDKNAIRHMYPQSTSCFLAKKNRITWEFPYPFFVKVVNFATFFRIDRKEKVKMKQRTKNKKTESIKIRVTPQEKYAMQKLAERTNTNVSHYILEMSLNGQITVLSKNDVLICLTVVRLLAEIQNDLYGVVRNINQITRNVNHRFKENEKPNIENDLLEILDLKEQCLKIIDFLRNKLDEYKTLNFIGEMGRKRRIRLRLLDYPDELEEVMETFDETLNDHYEELSSVQQELDNLGFTKIVKGELNDIEMKQREDKNEQSDSGNPQSLFEGSEI